MMKENEAIFFAVLMVANLFLLMPTFLYMLDKLNLYAKRKHGIVYWMFFWPFAPFDYLKVWKTHRQECHAFPMILWMVIVVVDIGGGFVLTVMDILG